MGEAKTIIKYGRIYAIANVINRAAGLILIPVYTNMLSVSEYGVYALVFSVTDLLSIIVGMGMGSAMSRIYFDFPENLRMRNRIVSTTILGFLGFGILIILCSYPMSRLIVEIIFGSPEHTMIFTLAICGIVSVVLLEIEVAYFVLQKRAMIYLAISSGKALLLLLTNVLFVYYLKLGVLGIVSAMIISFTTLSLIVGGGIFWKVGFGFSANIFKQLLSFGFPLIPAAVVNTGIRLIERYYLNSLVGVAAVGSLALANRLASLLQMLIAAPFMKIFSVRRFETLAKNDDQSIFNQILLILIAIISTSALFLGLFGSEIISIIAPNEYNNASIFIPLLCLSVILTVIARNFQLGILYQKNTKVIPIIAIISLCVSIPGNYYLISLYGSMGAVLAYLLVNIVRTCLVVLANCYVGASQIRLDWARATTILILSSLISTLGFQYWGSTITIPFILLKSGIFVFFVIFLITTPLLDNKSRKYIISFIKFRQ